MKQFIMLLIPVIMLLLVAVVMLGVKVLFVKGSKFPDGHVHSSPQLQKRGIRCAHHTAGGTDRS